MKTIEERQALALRLPWVTRVKDDASCDGIKWSTVAGRDISSWGPEGKNPPRGIQPRSRCKNRAKFHYKPLSEDLYRREGNYCWHHLVLLLDDEEPRASRYIERFLKEESHV